MNIGGRAPLIGCNEVVVDLRMIVFVVISEAGGLQLTGDKTTYMKDALGDGDGHHFGNTDAVHDKRQRRDEREQDVGI